jgi:hypothetical protein
VAFHGLPYAGQADARAGELAGRVQPLEWLEQIARVKRVKASAVVAHVTANGGVSCRGCTELDERVELI